MTDEKKKPRTVEAHGPSAVQERTNHLRINRDAAQRIIARHLREKKISPEEANTLANAICNSIVASMPTPDRPALRNWRMIPEHPGYEVAQELRRRLGDQIESPDEQTTRAIWKLIYDHGKTLPDDIVV